MNKVNGRKLEPFSVAGIFCTSLPDDVSVNKLNLKLFETYGQHFSTISKYVLLLEMRSETGDWRGSFIGVPLEQGKENCIPNEVAVMNIDDYSFKIDKLVKASSITDFDLKIQVYDFSNLEESKVLYSKLGGGA